MTEEIINIEGRNCHVVKSEDSFEAVIVKPLGEFERLLLLDECRMITELTDVPFIMIAFEVKEEDLLKDKVENTFIYLKDSLLPYIRLTLNTSHFTLNIVVGGYSLGGLFALWSATKLEEIDAVFAGSPSLWMEGWEEYASSHPIKAKYIYMSLGDKEEQTKKKPFCIIGDRVRQQHQLNIQQLGEENCILQWNEGGHFKDIEKRKASGFAWCLNKMSLLPFTSAILHG